MYVNPLSASQFRLPQLSSSHLSLSLSNGGIKHQSLLLSGIATLSVALDCLSVEYRGEGFNIRWLYDNSLQISKVNPSHVLKIELLFNIFPGNMEINSSHNSSIMWFFKDRGFDDKSIHQMFKKCKRLEGVQRERAYENWDYLRSIGIQDRKLPSVVAKCPKILTLHLDEKLIPMVQCLVTLETKPGEVASAITKFPHILSHSVEEKLCPLLAFFQALGVPEKQLGKMLLFNPRIISYSIESKLSQIVDFLASLGLTEEGMIGKVLVKNPFIMGYSVEKRLQPTLEFLKSIGLTKLDLHRVTVNFPEVVCRDVNKILRPNFTYLKGCGFEGGQIAALVTGYPPILIKSINNSLEPRIRFLVEVMGRRLEEVTDYPDFFRHGFKKRLQLRQKLLKQKNIYCSLSEMLDCNQKKFLLKFGLIE